MMKIFEQDQTRNTILLYELYEIALLDYASYHCPLDVRTAYINDGFNPFSDGSSTP